MNVADKSENTKHTNKENIIMLLRLELLGASKITLSSNEGIAFQFPRGSERFFGQPEEGQEAWFDTAPSLPREFRRFLGGTWVTDPDSTDDGL